MTVREFGGLKDFIGYIDTQIAQYRKTFGELIRTVEDLRARTEKLKKIGETISKLAPDAQAAYGGEESPQTDLKGVRVLINPSPFQELSGLEDLLEDINVRITKLVNIRKYLEALAAANPDGGGKVLVFFRDDVPDTVIIKI